MFTNKNVMLQISAYRTDSRHNKTPEELPRPVCNYEQWYREIIRPSEMKL